MRKTLQKLLPLLISCMLGFSIVTVAWVVQDANINGITITSATDGVKLLVSSGSNTYSDTLTFDISDAELIPVKWNEMVFELEDGTVVNGEDGYYLELPISVKSEVECNVSATITIDGDLPIKAAVGTNLITTDTFISKVYPKGTNITLYIWIDGETFTESGSATVSIMLHGDEIE